MIEKCTAPTPTLEVFNSLNDRIEEVTKDLFSTLGYDIVGEKIFNKAYFSSKDSISYDSLTRLCALADEKIAALHSLSEEIQKIEVLNLVQKDLFLKRIEKAILNFQYHQHAMYLEAEKAGFAITDEEREFHNKEKLLLEEKLYGPSLLHRPERLKKVGEKLYELYEQKKIGLSSEDQSFWEEKILSHFENCSSVSEVSDSSNSSVFINEETIFPLVETMLQLQGFKKQDLVKIQMSDDPHLDEVKKEGDIFIVPNLRDDKTLYDYFNQKGLGEKFKIIKQIKGTNNVSITPNKKHIKLGAPKNGRYDLKNSVLPIIFDHEIATHVQTGIGNLYNGNIKDSGRLDLEEGIALLNQGMSEEKSLDDIYESSIGDISQFFGEVLDDNELKKALEIYFFLSGNSGDQGDRFRRIRRGVARGEKGSRRQDLTYGNSKEILREFEELAATPEGRELLNQYARVIYSTKLGYDSLGQVEDILENIKSLNELEPHFPVFAGKILYWKLFKGKLDKEEMLKNDIRSIISTNQEITYSQKKLLVQLKQLIEQDVEYKKSKN
ncbi:MAG: hypothetical protein DLD55_02340 [candidate division SR1 bacterium]|nr:MAG: hypothetical protein DLD55_02340 [candidate division SR1 bacterium]